MATYSRSAPSRLCSCGVRVSRKAKTGKCLQCSRAPNKQALLSAITRFFIQHGRTPTAKEWQERAPGRPTTNHLAYAFGTFNAAIRAAGFTPRTTRQVTQRGPRLQPVFESREAELVHLIEEQASDYRLRFYAFAVDPMATRFSRGLYFSDAWTDAVHRLVDYRREIDSWA